MKKIEEKVVFWYWLVFILWGIWKWMILPSKSEKPVPVRCTMRYEYYAVTDHTVNPETKTSEEWRNFDCSDGAQFSVRSKDIYFGQYGSEVKPK